MSSKKNKQRGGEIHQKAISKNRTAISFPKGFPNLQKDGDYHIIHNDVYDPNDPRFSSIRADKLERLNRWVGSTFLDPEFSNNSNSDHIINSAYRIAISRNAEDFKKSYSVVF